MIRRELLVSNLTLVGRSTIQRVQIEVVLSTSSTLFRTLMIHRIISILKESRSRRKLACLKTLSKSRPLRRMKLILMILRQVSSTKSRSLEGYQSSLPLKTREDHSHHHSLSFRRWTIRNRIQSSPMQGLKNRHLFHLDTRAHQNGSVLLQSQLSSL